MSNGANSRVVKETAVAKTSGEVFVDLIADVAELVKSGNQGFALRVLRQGMLSLSFEHTGVISECIAVQPQEIDPRWDNLVAAWVEELAVRKHANVPEWTGRVEKLSSEWVFSGRTQGRLLEREIAETLPTFKRRNIVLRRNEIAIQ